MNNIYENITHPIAPVWDENSRILILGSFPSVKSRDSGFFYGHPQNRFWRVLADVFDTDIPITNAEKRELLMSHGIALWDVIASCEIKGSADGSIKNAKPNDIGMILNGADIRRIYVNGATAAKLYDKYILPLTGVAASRLPSTSPANAAWSFTRLCDEWKKITE